MASPVHMLPSELWRKILYYATSQSSSSNAHSVSERYLPSMGMRQKRAFSLVSKYFQGVMAEFLYEAVKITHSDQLQSLGCASHRKSFRQYTVYLAIDLTVLGLVRDRWSIIFKLIALCSRLQVFRLEPAKQLWCDIPRQAIKALVKLLPRSLEIVTWIVVHGDGYLFGGIFHLLARNLPLLRIIRVRERLLKPRDAAPLLPETQDDVSKQEPLAVDHLEQIDIDDTDDIFFSALRKLWSTPRLSYITVRRLGTLNIPIPSVTHLEITETSLNSMKDMDLGGLIHSAPNLKELLYTINPSNSRDLWKYHSSFAHPEITAITVMLETNIRGEFGHWRELAAHLLQIPFAGLPSLMSLVIRNIPSERHHADLHQMQTALVGPAAFLQARGVELRLER